MHAPVITAATEGGYYSPNPDTSAPIRIYADRRVEDDIYTAHTGVKVRETLSPEQFNSAVNAAAANRASGLV
jgi:hypothetical protein